MDRRREMCTCTHTHRKVDQRLPFNRNSSRSNRDNRATHKLLENLHVAVFTKVKRQFQISIKRMHAKKIYRYL